MRIDGSTRTLIAANRQVLRQGLELLGQLDDRVYREVNSPLLAYGVGSHFRHCLDSYQCLLNGLASGRVDYDQRERDRRIETDRGWAMAHLEAIRSRLADLPAEAQLPLVARLDSPSWAVTSLPRELQYLLSHTIHHYALIALMLRLQGSCPPDDFGVAPSTLDYWQSREAEFGEAA